MLFCDHGRYCGHNLVTSFFCLPGIGGRTEKRLPWAAFPGLTTRPLWGAVMIEPKTSSTDKTDFLAVWCDSVCAKIKKSFDTIGALGFVADKDFLKYLKAAEGDEDGAKNELYTGIKERTIRISALQQKKASDRHFDMDFLKNGPQEIDKKKDFEKQTLTAMANCLNLYGFIKSCQQRGTITEDIFKKLIDYSITVLSDCDQISIGLLRHAESRISGSGNKRTDKVLFRRKEIAAECKRRYGGMPEKRSSEIHKIKKWAKEKFNLEGTQTVEKDIRVIRRDFQYWKSLVGRGDTLTE